MIDADVEDCYDSDDITTEKITVIIMTVFLLSMTKTMIVVVVAMTMVMKTTT